MYSVIMWEIDPNAPDPPTIEGEAIAALDGRRTCRISDGKRITRVASGTDFLRVHEALKQVADDHPGLFRYALWALAAGSAMRTNIDHDEDCEGEVTDG